jgi:hypothetical protein
MHRRVLANGAPVARDLSDQVIRGPIKAELLLVLGQVQINVLKDGRGEFLAIPQPFF